MYDVYLSSSAGLFQVSLDPRAGRFENFRQLTDVSTRWLLPDLARGLLFATAHDPSLEKGRSGAVRAFRFGGDGQLELINQQSTHGNSACHASLLPGGRALVAANYGDSGEPGRGSLVRFPIGEDGTVEPALWRGEHEGSGPNAKRQTCSHPHSVVVHPSGGHLASGDLGIDRVMVYRILDSDHTLLPTGDGIAMPPGSGPRHLAWNATGEILYVMNELAATVGVVAFDPDTGLGEAIQVVDALPPGYKGERSGADIHLHPSGRFLYSSNRGHDSIAAFQVDEKTGLLEWTGTTSTKGNIPRGFGLSPAGDYLVAANEKSGEIVLYRIDPSTGAPTAIDQSPDVPSCQCVRIV